MKVSIFTPIVSVDWLHQNLDAENLIILDGTIPKVGEESALEIKQQLPNALFFDIKHVFSDTTSPYPNTILPKEQFEDNVQQLGINKDSCIVVYDDLGIYSAARVWWLFKIFGCQNIAVLDGGLPQWIAKGYITESPVDKTLKKGDFKVNYKAKMFSSTEDVLKAIEQPICIADARAASRFYAEVEEPRAGMRSGHIPNSKSLPHSTLKVAGIMKSKDALAKVFSEINPRKEPFIFTCGSGVTACILALGLEIIGEQNYSIYDGSWSEWGSREELPIDV